MLTARWEPWAEINRLRNDMDRLLGRGGAGQPGRFGVGVYPLLNVWEDNDNLYVEAELPGIELSDLEIYVTGGNQLSIKGQRQAPEKNLGTWHRQERGYGNFNRVIELPSEVQSDKVAAGFKHGVLTITLPKSEEVRPRRIKVKSD